MRDFEKDKACGRKLFNPVYGQVYENRGGGKFRCVTPPHLNYPNGEARMMNVLTGWTFRAVGVIQHPDGSIEWDYSSGGYFTKIRGGIKQ